MFLFYIFWKDHQKFSGFLIFSVVAEREHWSEIGEQMFEITYLLTRKKEFPYMVIYP